MMSVILTKKKQEFSRNLGGLVLESFEQLNDRFPIIKGIGGVYSRAYNKGDKSHAGIRIYSRPIIKSELKVIDIAYGCIKVNELGCDKIIIGSPESRVNSKGGENPEYHCYNCGSSFNGNIMRNNYRNST